MMRARRRAPGLTLLGLLFVLICDPQPTAAAELGISWSAPPECPTADDLRERVMEQLATSPRSELTAATVVNRLADSYRAHIVLSDASGFGEREIEDASCAVLLDKVALVIALSIPSQDLAQPTSRRPVVTLSVEGRLLLGAVPLMAAGLGGAVGLEALSSLRFQVHGTYYAPQSDRFSGTMLGARFELLTFGARACRSWNVGPLQLGPCLGAELHYARATAFGGMPSLTGRVQWWGPALSLFSRLTLLEHFALYIAAEVVAPLSHPRFQFSDAGDLHRVSALELQFIAAPEVRF